jgi:serine/threonine-protein kinase
LEGESLGERLARTGTLSPVETVRVLTHAARALDKAHELGIVHRDVKPDNIFLAKGDDGLFSAKMLDFGIAKAKTDEWQAASSGLTRTGSLVGSPFYMSPEQVQHAKEVDHRSDLWSLGVIVYECLLGSRPFDSDALVGLLLSICTENVPTPSNLGTVPAGFDDWFKKACSRAPADRFQTAKEMADALRAVVFSDRADPNGQAADASMNSTAPQAASTLSIAKATLNDVGQLFTESDRPEPPAKQSTRRIVAVAAFFAMLLIAAGIGAFLSRKAATEDVGAGPESPELVRSSVMEPDASASAIAPAATEPRKDPIAELVDPERAAPPNTTRIKTAPPKCTRTAELPSTTKPPSTREATATAPASARPPATMPPATRDYGF